MYKNTYKRPGHGQEGSQGAGGRLSTFAGPEHHRGCIAAALLPISRSISALQLIWFRKKSSRPEAGPLSEQLSKEAGQRRTVSAPGQLRRGGFVTAV